MRRMLFGIRKMDMGDNGREQINKQTGHMQESGGKKKGISRIAMAGMTVLLMGLVVSCGDTAEDVSADAAQITDKNDTNVTDLDADNPATADTVTDGDTDLSIIDSAADEAAPDDTASDGAASDDAAQDGTVSDDAAQDGTATDDTDPNGAAPDSTVADDTSRTEDSAASREAAREAFCEEQVVKIENPGWAYYFDGTEPLTGPIPFSLELVSEEANEITDDLQWFAEHGLDRPRFPYSDETYWYETFGDNDDYLLKLSDWSSGETVTLDFSDYMYAEEYVQADYDYIGQRIIYAQAKDGILYVATGHNTYAASCPQTAYITAVDLTDYHVIWKTEPLTCNSYSFALIDDYIVCGYGFTAEDDALKIVDMGAGQVVEEIPIKTMAYYIIWEYDKLFVRTYNMNYEYKVVRGD